MSNLFPVSWVSTILCLVILLLLVNTTPLKHSIKPYGC